MNILAETRTVLAPLDIPIETGVFKNKAPDTYIVLVPLSDTFPLSADNIPQVDVQELRITLYAKNNYLQAKNKIVKSLLSNDFTITDRRYGGYDTDTGYYQYTIDIAKHYEFEMEEN